MMIFLSSSNMMGIEKLKNYRLNAKNQKTKILETSLERDFEPQFYLFASLEFLEWDAAAAAAAAAATNFWVSTHFWLGPFLQKINLMPG